MLLLCLMALSDQKNKPAPAGYEPIAVGLLVVLIGMSLGSNSGYAINPTRDIAPRIFTAIAGWGVDVFRYVWRTSCCCAPFCLTRFLPLIQYKSLFSRQKAEFRPSHSCLNLCRSGNGWWWVPITAPFIGGLLGAGVYKIMVEIHHPVTSKRGEELMKEESISLGKQENAGANVCFWEFTLNIPLCLRLQV